MGIGFREMFGFGQKNKPVSPIEKEKEPNWNAVTNASEQTKQELANDTLGKNTDQALPPVRPPSDIEDTQEVPAIHPDQVGEKQE